MMFKQEVQAEIDNSLINQKSLRYNKMISFRKFIKLNEEVTASRRQGIQHLSDMKPEQFIQWMKLVKSELGGVLKNIKAVMKIDRIRCEIR